MRIDFRLRKSSRIAFKLRLILCVDQTAMAKKDKISKEAEKKARVAAKQSKKIARNEKKFKSKGADDSDAEDVDLESVLEEYAKQVGNFPSEASFNVFKPAHNVSKPNFSKSRRLSADLHLLARRQLLLALPPM